jgi:bifunctional DNase/RNase
MSAELLIELKPIGINVNGSPSKPLLLLKDSSGDLTMPLPISPLEAGVLMQQTGRGPTLATPHYMTEQILHFAGIKIERCVFTEYRSQVLYCRLDIEGQSRFLETKAEHAVSLCLYLNVPLYATRDLIWKARNQAVEMQEQSEFMIFQTAAIRPHHYLM